MSVQEVRKDCSEVIGDDRTTNRLLKTVDGTYIRRLFNVNVVASVRSDWFFVRSEIHCPLGELLICSPFPSFFP